MGKFDFYVSPEFIKQLGKMADVERISPKMIDEAMPILKKSVVSELTKHKDNGDMVESVKFTKAKKTKNGGYYAIVRPTGKDRKGVRNMEKAAYLEYGTSKEAGSGAKDKQSPEPWVVKSINDAEPAVLNKMQEVFNREGGN